MSDDRNPNHQLILGVGHVGLGLVLLVSPTAVSAWAWPPHRFPDSGAVQEAARDALAFVPLPLGSVLGGAVFLYLGAVRLTGRRPAGAVIPLHLGAVLVAAAAGLFGFAFTQPQGDWVERPTPNGSVETRLPTTWDGWVPLGIALLFAGWVVWTVGGLDDRRPEGRRAVAEPGDAPAPPA